MPEIKIIPYLFSNIKRSTDNAICILESWYKFIWNAILSYQNTQSLSKSKEIDVNF